jgi:hypothetical protein
MILYTKNTPTYKKGGKLDARKPVPEWLKPYVGNNKPKNGIYRGLTGKPEGGFSMGADANGFFLYTHRGRSKSRMDTNFTQKEKDWVESTG